MLSLLLEVLAEKCRWFFCQFFLPEHFYQLQFVSKSIILNIDIQKYVNVFHQEDNLYDAVFVAGFSVFTGWGCFWR